MLGLLAQTTTTTSAGVGAGGAALIAGGAILYIAFIVLMIASMWKLFDKAGQRGWCAIVPILNIVVLIKVVHKELWWILLFLIPCVNIVAFIVIYFNVAKAFGKGAAFGIGTIILPWIFVPILGFGKSQYVLQPDPLF